MGSLVTLTIATDHLGELERAPRRLVEIVREGMTTPRADWRAPGVWVQRVHHRSDLSVYVVGGRLHRPWELSAVPECVLPAEPGPDELWLLEALRDDARRVRQRAADAEERVRQAIVSLPG